MDRQRAKRRPATRGSAPTSLLGGRTGWVVVGGGAAVGLLGFSLAWPSGVGLAVVAGIVSGVAWLAVTLGFVIWRRRAAPRPADGRSIGPR
jgi:cation transporter-like permease